MYIEGAGVIAVVIIVYLSLSLALVFEWRWLKARAECRKLKKRLEEEEEEKRRGTTALNDTLSQPQNEAMRHEKTPAGMATYGFINHQSTVRICPLAPYDV